MAQSHTLGRTAGGGYANALIDDDGSLVTKDSVLTEAYDADSNSLRTTMIGIADVVVDNAIVNVNESGVGTVDQTKVTDPTLDASLIQLMKGLLYVIEAGIAASVSGSVAVSNFPATQPVSGSVAVSNFPATQPVSGSVAVSNLPATQPVSGSVSVSNLPATQPVSGSVSVSNLPATQPVSLVDGADVTQGAKADAAVTSAASSASIIALLKGLLAQLQPSATWDVITTGDTSAANFAGGVGRAIHVGTAGDVAVVQANGTAKTIKGVASGVILPVAAIRVNTTNTTASNMTVLY